MRDHLDWNLVRTFVAVAEQGSLSGAARQLGLAHPTVARHVQQLEEALEVRLFERTAAGLAINEAGLRLAHVARRMHRDALAFEAISESVRTSRRGTVRITIAEVLADLLPEVLADLRIGEEEGDRVFELDVSADQLNLLEREADIAIRHVRPEQSDLVCRQVGRIPMGAFASHAYIARNGLPTVATIASHFFVDGASQQRFAMAVERLGYRIPQDRVLFRTDSLHAQRRAAEAGWGVVALPVYMGAASPDLAPVLGDAGADDESLEIWVVGRPGLRQQALLKEVSDHLASALGARFPADWSTAA